jgi:hypothetical protein
MDRRKLESLRRQVRSLRRSQPKARDLEALAVRLGRKTVNRGKEPTYESKKFFHLRPLSIPHHKGRDLPTGTKNSILSQLEEDIDAWEETLSQKEHGNGTGNGEDTE